MGVSTSCLKPSASTWWTEPGVTLQALDRQAPALPSTHTSFPLCVFMGLPWILLLRGLFSVWSVLLLGQGKWQLFPQKIVQVSLVDVSARPAALGNAGYRQLWLTFPRVWVKGNDSALFSWLAWSRSREGVWWVICWMKDGIFEMPWAVDGQSLASCPPFVYSVNIHRSSLTGGYIGAVFYVFLKDHWEQRKR